MARLLLRTHSQGPTWRRRKSARQRFAALLLGAGASLTAVSASAQSTPETAAPPAATGEPPAPVPRAPAAVDRVVVRYSAPEMGGVDHPRFIFARVLAFEARLEALADPTFRGGAPFAEQHVESAIQRHIAETILEGLEVSPAPSPADIRERVQSARIALALRAGGAQAVDNAAALEGLEPYEVLRIVQRQARASLYLDRMVAPMLEPSDPELRGIHQSGRTPFSKSAYEEVEPALRRWYVARRLREAVLSYFEGSRLRVQVSVVGPLATAFNARPEQ